LKECQWSQVIRTVSSTCLGLSFRFAFLCKGTITYEVVAQ
jgi:hypothetical protein